MNTPHQSTADALLETAKELAIDLVEPSGAPVTERLPIWLRVVHLGIIANLGLQCLYIGFQVFFVLQPEGTFGPMFGAATQLPFDLMMTRRMYALEGWVAFLGLGLYLGLTEVLPRRWR